MANINYYPMGDGGLGRQKELARPLTPKSERWYEGRIPSISIIGKGYCEVTRKCFRKANHKGACWPT